ncbi:glycosyltransferase family 4 protein [Salipiger bermudensis]|uniref:glycosyltransferase family 4 protein n=1 Tax=Salipiger bermudensis TaxID=344736 RepID=UPI001CD4DD7F|nr:glycosyltransferase family 1 protein [Salipiger bermudensis]MCA0962875.1 glycosyltransferase family 4 protein [Salipiger bermudensis]
MDITRADPPPRLLDLTRLVSRAGRPFTGIDRVEYAYLRRLLRSGPLYGLVRSSLGYLLLDRRGCAELKRRIDGDDWAAPDLLAKLRRLDPGRAGAERALRAVAVARCLPRGLVAMLRRQLPAGTQYLNIGHTNFTDRTIAALRGIPGIRIAVLLHDTLPLDVPEHQRPGIPERFEGFLTRVGRHADLVICNSHQTERDLRRHLPDSAAQSVVAHLGIDLPTATIAPGGPWQGRPYFVALGTIEPRKNHALLLDIWEQQRPPADLLICGSRGWNNDAVFARLDAGIAGVHELPGLDDGQIAALLKGSAGMLFPSLAEGYGLPPMEAACLGVPVLASNLSVLREVLGDIPVYAPVADRYLWAQLITTMAEDHRAGQGAAPDAAAAFAPPSWDAHFETVFTLI